MTLDDKTETPTPPGQLWGGILMAVGAGAITVGLTSSLSRPPAESSAFHSTLLFLGLVIVIVGLATYAVSTIITSNGRVTDRLAVQVEANNLVLRQLSAAPTVRLQEVQLAMNAFESAVRDAVETSAKSIEGRIDELERHMREESTLVRDAFDAGVRIGASRRESHSPEAGSAELVQMDDVRMLKRIDEKLRRASGEDAPER